VEATFKRDAEEALRAAQAFGADAVPAGGPAASGA